MNRRSKPNGNARGQPHKDTEVYNVLSDDLINDKNGYMPSYLVEQSENELDVKHGIQREFILKRYDEANSENNDKSKARKRRMQKKAQRRRHNKKNMTAVSSTDTAAMGADPQSSEANKVERTDDTEKRQKQRNSSVGQKQSISDQEKTYKPFNETNVYEDAKYAENVNPERRTRAKSEINTNRYGSDFEFHSDKSDNDYKIDISASPSDTEKRRTINKEFELKRSRTDTESLSRSVQNEQKENITSRGKRRRKKSKSKAADTSDYSSDVSDDQQTYEAFNNTNAYEEAKYADSIRAEREASRALKGNKDIEFVRHDSSDTQFGVHKERADIEFGTARNTDIDFNVGNMDADIDLKSSSDKGSEDVNFRNAKMEIKPGGEHEDKFVQFGQKSKRKSEKHRKAVSAENEAVSSEGTIQSITSGAEENKQEEIRKYSEIQSQTDEQKAFAQNSESAEGFSERERTYRSQAEGTEINVKADKADFEFHIRQKADEELFKAAKRDADFELKNSKNDFSYQELRSQYHEDINFGEFRTDKKASSDEKIRSSKDRKIRRNSGKEDKLEDKKADEINIQYREIQSEGERASKLNTERETALKDVFEERRRALKFEDEENINQDKKLAVSNKEAEKLAFETEKRLEFENEEVAREAREAELVKRSSGELGNPAMKKTYRNLKFESDILKEQQKKKALEQEDHEYIYFQLKDGSDTQKRRQGSNSQKASRTNEKNFNYEQSSGSDAGAGGFSAHARERNSSEERSNRFRSAEERTEKAKKKYDKAREKYEREAKKRHNSLKFDRDDMKRRIAEKAVLETMYAVHNDVNQLNEDENVAVEAANKITDVTGRAAYRAYKWQKNKPQRLKMNAERAKEKYENEKNRFNFEQASERQKAYEADKVKNTSEYAAKAKKTAEKRRQEAVQRKLQRGFYRKLFQRQYQKVYISNLAKKAYQKIKQWVMSILTSKVKFVIIGVAAVIILFVLIFGIAAMMLTSAVGGYIDENVTTSEEVRDFAVEWANMEEDLGDDYFANLYPGWIIHYYNLSAIGVDIGQVTAYYNAVNGKFTYEDSISTTYPMTIYDLFEYIYSWDIEEEIVNEGTEYEEYHVHATLNVRSIDDLINALTDEQKELYEACLEIFYQDEEYNEIWNELVM